MPVSDSIGVVCRRNGIVSALIALTFFGAACSPSGPSLATDETQAEPQPPTETATPSPSESSTPEQPSPAPGTPPTALDEPDDEANSTPAPQPTSPSNQGPTQPTPEAQASDEDSSAAATCTAGLAGQPGTTSEAAGDVDGDGANDLITTYSLTNGSGEVTGWRIRYDTAAGESLDSPIAKWSPGDPVQPIGSADVDGDGATQEAFVVVGAGASTALVSIFVTQGCSIVAATAQNGPATFAIGGSIVNIAGLECLDRDDDGTNDTIVAWTGESDPSASEGTFLIDGIEYRLRGSALAEVGNQTLVANLASADFAYDQLSCGSLGL
ncbi:MAG: hypothetical protein ACR2PK_15110 [Acidimicrobiales bacterium]